MEKNKIIKTSARLLLGGFIILGFFLFTTAIKAEEPEGAFNNVLVKDFPVKYHESTGTINGEAIIGNFSDQSFYNLNYKLELLAYGKDIDLGTVVHEEFSSNSFSIQGQGEVRESFSYKIPEGVPSGDYNFVFQIVDSRGRPLGFGNYPFTYSNNTNNLITVNPESIKIEVNKEDHHWGEGPSTKKEDEVKLKFELANNNQKSITDVTPYLTVYPYTSSLKKVYEKDLELFSLNAGETRQFSYQMPELANPQSYLVVVEFKKDNQLVALPVRGRWVVEGIQGKIFTSGIDKNNNLTLEVIGSPFSKEESGTAMISILDENGNLCFSQEKKINKMGAGTQIVSLPINFQKQCFNPTVKVDLRIKDKLVDTYEKKLDSDSVKQLQIIAIEKDTDIDKEKKINKKKIALLFLIIPVILILIILIINRDRDKGKKNIGLLSLIILSGTMLFSFLPVREANAWVADTGNYLSIGNSYLYNRYFFPSSDQSAITTQRNCLNARNDYCYVGSRLYYEGFYEAQWQNPTPNQIFEIGENIPCSISNIRAWCYNLEMPTKIKWNVFSRLNNQVIKSGTKFLPGGIHSAGWSIDSLPEGKYAIYFNLYFSPSGFGDVLLYQGMIRYFDVVGCDCSSPACYESQEELLANDPFCTGGGTHGPITYHSEEALNISPWTWTWDCNLGDYIKSNCRAYKAPECGSANDGTYTEAESFSGNPENLCSVGYLSEGVMANDNGWEWSCGNGTCLQKNCSAVRETVAPFCSLSPHNTSICEGETSTVTVDGLAPAKGSANLTKVNWNSPNSGELGSWSSTQPDIYTNITWDDGKFKFDIVGLSVSSINPINFFVNDGTGSYEAQCNTAVYIKPAGCNVSVSPSENLTVGTSVNITIMPECIEQVDSYDLDILYQGTDDPTSWEYVDGDISDGEVTITIKEAGVFTFDATVEGDINGPGGTTDCNCQTTAFTSGSKWWERDTE